jgi:hypothetical protein
MIELTAYSMCSHMFLSVDFSQYYEVFIIANVTADRDLISLLLKGTDIFQYFREILGLPMDTSRYQQSRHVVVVVVVVVVVTKVVVID